MSTRYLKRGYQLKQPKPRKKDPEVELQKQLRREQVNQELRERLEAIQLTEKDILSKDTVF